MSFQADECSEGKEVIVFGCKLLELCMAICLMCRDGNDCGCDNLE